MKGKDEFLVSDAVATLIDENQSPDVNDRPMRDLVVRSGCS